MKNNGVLMAIGIAIITLLSCFVVLLYFKKKRDNADCDKDCDEELERQYEELDKKLDDKVVDASIIIQKRHEEAATIIAEAINHNKEVHSENVSELNEMMDKLDQM